MLHHIVGMLCGIYLVLTILEWRLIWHIMFKHAFCVGNVFVLQVLKQAKSFPDYVMGESYE